MIHNKTTTNFVLNLNFFIFGSVNNYWFYPLISSRLNTNDAPHCRYGKQEKREEEPREKEQKDWKIHDDPEAVLGLRGVRQPGEAEERLEGDESAANEKQLVDERQEGEDQVAGSDQASDGDDNQGSPVEALQPKS